MRAVAVTNMPRNFSFPEDLEDAYIGDFFIGGNNGSMLYDGEISLLFPEKLNIYHKIVGGCNQATVSYKNITHRGGLIAPLTSGTDKLHLSIKSRFLPMELQYPAIRLEPPIVLRDNFVNAKGETLYKADANGDYVIDPAYTGLKFYPDGQCNVYGGCYQSGTVVGNITIDLYSDMLDYGATTLDAKGDGRINKQAIVDAVDENSWRAFTVIGGGYGLGTEVYGDIQVRMLPTKTGETVTHPSVSSIFGGSQEGLVVGNTTVEIRDGKVLTNVYGASEAAELYGSTQVVVGYPRYYRAKTHAIYTISRVDNLSQTSLAERKKANGEYVLPHTVAYRAGDIITDNLLKMITGVVTTVPDNFKIGQKVTSGVTAIDPASPTSYAPYFSEEYRKPSDIDASLTWDDIEIWVGDQGSRTDDNIPYYGHGNVYGGGFLPRSSNHTLAGKSTVLRFTDQLHPEGFAETNYGGNTCVLIWDNADNADLTKTDAKDHISVGTGRFMPVATKVGLNKMGFFVKAADGTYVYQTSGKMEEGVKYYSKDADGGVYGGGRKVFAQGFRSIDIAYYGYAEGTPQRPRLLNTLQRADVATITDCCLELVGASDFTTDILNEDYGTLYSVNRVNELRMISSLPADGDIVPGVRDEAYNGVIRHNSARTRNYIGFYYSANHLGSFYSNWSLDDAYHGHDGAKIDGQTFEEYKHDIIREYDNMLADMDSYTDANKNTILDKFNQRNVGTSANMIGINSGFALRFEGVAMADEGATDETMYYGPAYGVTEIKLLTVTQGEGGGYVYALNHHDEDLSKQDFMITTGNFVFPGAAYMSGPTNETSNYIFDDCDPPNYGYYGYKKDWKTALGISSQDGGSAFDVNKEQEVHHWYINGQIFYYNVTLTGITSDDNTKDGENGLSFYLNSEDDVVKLVTLRENATIKIKEVLWYDHDSESGITTPCDINDLGKNYKLYFSVGHDTHNNLEPGNKVGTYVSQIPRADYAIASGSTDAGVNPNLYVDDQYTYCASGESNIPRLGIRLVDKQKNRLADQSVTAGREYYDKYLKDPHKVQVEIETQNPAVDGVEQPIYTYIITLDIKYLLGPMLKGLVDIENCALPGEYIYVNANDVDVDMDETNLAVTRQYWRLYPNDANGERIKDIHGVEIYEDLDLDDYAVKVNGKINEKLIHIPAYYYQNGWEVVYGITAGGFDFESKLAVDEPDPDDPSKTMEHTRLTVHNYHRMHAFDDTQVHDLKLVPGARVYIEDDEDIKAFFAYVDRMQDDRSVDIPGDDTRKIDPQYCEGLDFYLQTNVTLPTKDKVSFAHSKVLFKGTFHGNGHVMDILDNTSMPIENAGSLYNTGFISMVNNDATKIIKDNTGGRIINCYYVNPYLKGTLADNGYLENCYQNTAANPTFVAGLDLLQLSSQAFMYGQVAYNLNGFYLQKRDLLLRAGTPNTLDALRTKDMDERENPDFAVDYIEHMFNNGDYQYALWRQKGQFEQALRTADMPNYLDMMGYHEKGISPTHHDTSHPHDPLRWCETHKMNHPSYGLDDYMFFGQEISPDADKREYIERLPTQFTPDTRVYRVSGFYGSNIDRGYFLNRSPYIHSDILTAIDFTGFRDREPEIVAKVASLRAQSDWNGWMIATRDNVKQDIYYPPTIDVSFTESDLSGVNLLVSDDVTRNLLIYGHGGLDIYETFHYQDGSKPVLETDMASYDASGIRAHHIVIDEPKASVYGGYLCLVDEEPFNAPRGFEYDNMWYNRQPKGFADGTVNKSAWEGIYLPFTVDKVYAASTSVNVNRDHREVSHFYGNENTLHEYWLRRMTGADAATGKLMFERPTAENALSATDSIATYQYENTYFWDTFKNLEYVPGHNAYSSQHVFTDYRYLTGAVPYIVSYPGVKYREFDMSGEFYSSTIPGESNPAQQTICYLAQPNSICPMTDALGKVTYKFGDYEFAGTFERITVDDAKYMVVNEYDGNGADGTSFVRPYPGHVISPFRTYVTYTGNTSTPHLICGRGVEGDPDDEDAPGDGGDEIGEMEIDIYVEYSDLIVRSPSDTDMIIYNTLGQRVRQIHVETGENRYTGLRPGFYIVHDRKVYIP